MAIMNSFLSKLQLPDTREQNHQQEPEDENRGVVLPMKPRKTNGQEAVLIGYQTAASGHKAVLDGRRMFNDPIESVTESGFRWSWAWKATRNREKNRPLTLYKALFSGAVVATALYSTYRGVDTDLTLQCYIVAFAVCLMCDPLDIFGRVVAFASRILTGIDLLLWVVNANLYSEDFQRTMIYGTAILLLAVIALNKRWLKSENWLYSQNVEHALTIDPDNEASTAWHGEGRRATRTLLHEIGHDITDSDLDGIMKPVFSLGFWTEYERKTKMENEIAELEEMNQEAENYIAELEEHIEEFEQKEARIDAIIAEKDRLQKELEEYKGSYQLMLTHYQEQLAESSGTIEQLEADLAASQEEQPALPTDREGMGDYILQVREETAGKVSFQKLADQLGISKAHAQKLAKEATERRNLQRTAEELEELPEASGGKVVVFR